MLITISMLMKPIIAGVSAFNRTVNLFFTKDSEKFITSDGLNFTVKS